MELKPYLLALTKSAKENDDDQAPLRAKEMQKALELKSVQLESSIAKRQAQIAKLTTVYPIDFNSLTSSLDDLALLERELAQLNQIGNQLFPTGQ